jgi:hypothetical protein
MRLLGILLIIGGIVLLIFGGLTLFIPSDVFNMGPFTFAINENITLPLPPVVGIVCLLVGIFMVMSAPVYYPPPY